MSKVTSKLQVTVPKAIADQYRIRPGDEILWVASGDTVRIVPARGSARPESAAERVRLFDGATERQQRRQANTPTGKREARGWTREDLYDRGRSR